MKKMISLVLVVVFAILASAIPAQAQPRTPYYGGGGYYDRYGYDQGNVRCQYDRYGRPYNCRHYDYRRYDRRGGSVVPFIAGAVVGGVVGAVVASRQNRPEQPAYQPGYQQTPYPYEVPVEAVAPKAQPSPVAGPVVGRDESHGPAYRPGPHPVANATRVYVDVYDGDKKPDNFVGTLESGESFDLARPKNRYRVWGQIPNDRGSFDEEEFHTEDKSANTKGWTFIEPVTAQGGK